MRGLIVVVAVAAIGASACSSGEVGGAGTTDTVTLQDSCEALIDQAPAAEVRMTPDPRRPRWSMQPSEPIRQLLGYRWDPADNTLTLYDGLEGQLLTFDTLGHLVQRSLRGGEGPGELHQGWGAPGRPPRAVYVAHDSAALIIDPHRLSRFEPGFRFAGRREFTPMIGWAMRETSLDTWDSTGAVLSTTGQWQGGTIDPAIRERITLTRVDLGTGVEQAVGLLRNQLVYLGYDSLPGARRVDPINGDVPFARLFGRSWDTEGGRLSFVSWRGYGVCSMDIMSRRLVAFRIAADTVPVTDAEKEWALRLDRVDPDARMEMSRMTQREAYAPLWQTTEPYYLDVLQGTDGETWALRRTPERTFVTDRFTVDAGYLGTFPVPSYTGQPMELKDGNALSRYLDEDGEVHYEMRVVAVTHASGAQ